MPEANGEISNEFFKKLNQQIVQKDNLIKLLQLQIRVMQKEWPLMNIRLKVVVELVLLV